MSAFDESMSNYNRSDGSSGEDYTGLFISLTLTVLQLFVSGFSLFFVIYLSIRLKKGAWDSSAKRFGQIFHVCFTLTFLLFAAVIFMFAFNSLAHPIIFVLVSTIGLSLLHVSFLYFTAMYAALSVQLVAPFLPEKLKVCAQKTYCGTLTECILHLLFLLFLISSPVVLHIDPYTWIIIMSAVSGSVSIIIILFSVILIFSFAFLMKFFKNHNINKKPIKHMIIKLILLFICFTFIITSIILAFSFLSLSLTIVLFFVLIVLFFILSISVVLLNHPLDIWCCIYCFRKSPTCEPSLPINATERQLQTNPVSVWNHSNVPSYTVTNLPIEMSDCRSDYV